MPTVVATGSSDARRISVASQCASYRGVRYCSALLGSGYVGIFGGKTVDAAGAETKINLITLFRIVSTSLAPDGATIYAYEWRRSSAPLLNSHIEDAQAVALTDPNHAGKALLCGGHTATASVQAATTLVGHRTSPEVFTAVALSPMGAARGMHRTTVLADGRVLVAGGFTAYPTALGSCQRWTPATELWGAAASMPTPRFDHGQIRLADGRVLAAGGRTGASTYTRAAEVYDPTGNAWAATGSLAHARAGHQLVLLPSGQVLAVGGTGPGGAVAETEIWDPGVGLWRPVGANAVARARPAAAWVPALGAVLLAGGDVTATELWYPTTGAWRAGLATLGRIRRDVQAIVLPEGVVLLPGGTEFTGAAWETTEHSHLHAPGAERVGGGALDGEHVVTTVPGPTQLRYQSSLAASATAGAGGTILPVTAPTIDFAGAHLVDPVGPSVTGTRATVAVRLEGGRGHGVLTLAASFSDPSPATRFPAEGGWLVLRFARTGQVGPIRLLGVRSATELRLDASAVFPADVDVGDDVTLLAGRDAFVPPTPAGGYLYLTASPSGRVAASRLLDDVAAAGVRITKHVEYSGDVGLGAQGAPVEGAPRLSGIANAFAGDQVDQEIAAAREAG